MKVQGLTNRVNPISCVRSPICTNETNFKITIPKFYFCFKATVILFFIIKTNF